MLPYDAILHVLKFLPFEKQYKMAADVIPPTYSDPFAKDCVYISERVSRVYDDIFGKYLVSKYGIPLEPYNKNTWKIDVNTPVYNIPFGFDHSSAIHKIPIWQKLFNDGNVGDYYLSIRNCFSTVLENFEITLFICNKQGSTTDFVASIEVASYDWNGDLILGGVRDIDFVATNVTGFDFIQNIDDAAFSDNIYVDQTMMTWDDGTVICYTDPPGCNHIEYNIGLSKEDVIKLLF